MVLIVMMACSEGQLEESGWSEPVTDEIVDLTGDEDGFCSRPAGDDVPEGNVS